jgi:hypothetical protein
MRCTSGHSRRLADELQYRAAAVDEAELRFVEEERATASCTLLCRARCALSPLSPLGAVVLCCIAAPD